MQYTVSCLVEVPESLHDQISTFLETHSDWDLDRVVTAALSLFLLQNSDPGENPGAAREYLQSVIGIPKLFPYASK